MTFKVPVSKRDDIVEEEWAPELGRGWRIRMALGGLCVPLNIANQRDEWEGI